jgi:hypothetical protein
MTTLLEDPQTDSPTTQQSTLAGRQLRTTMAAARLSFTWLGVR